MALTSLYSLGWPWISLPTSWVLGLRHVPLMPSVWCWRWDPRTCVCCAGTLSSELQPLAPSHLLWAILATVHFLGLPMGVSYSFCNASLQLFVSAIYLQLSNPILLTKLEIHEDGIGVSLGVPTDFKTNPNHGLGAVSIDRKSVV